MLGSIKVKVAEGNVTIKQKPPGGPVAWAAVLIVALIVLTGIYLMLKTEVFL